METGNSVLFELPGRRLMLRLSLALFLAVAGGFVIAAVGIHHGSVNWAAILSTLAVVAGANTIAYEYPITGATAPSADVMFKHQSLSAIVTGDGADTAITITHNWGLTPTEIADAFPWVTYEQILAAGYTAAPLVASRTADTVVFSCTVFTGAGLRIRLQRPWTPLR